MGRRSRSALLSPEPPLNAPTSGHVPPPGVRTGSQFNKVLLCENAWPAHFCVSWSSVHGMRRHPQRGGGGTAQALTSSCRGAARHTQLTSPRAFQGRPDARVRTPQTLLRLSLCPRPGRAWDRVTAGEPQVTRVCASALGGLCPLCSGGLGCPGSGALPPLPAPCLCTWGTEGPRGGQRATRGDIRTAGPCSSHIWATLTRRAQRAHLVLLDLSHQSAEGTLHVLESRGWVSVGLGLGAGSAGDRVTPAPSPPRLPHTGNPRAPPMGSRLLRSSPQGGPEVWIPAGEASGRREAAGAQRGPTATHGNVAEPDLPAQLTLQRVGRARGSLGRPGEPS
ncbi:uncharacterized protein AAEQ78_014789 [Lycaon pictus]